VNRRVVRRSAVGLVAAVAAVGVGMAVVRRDGNRPTRPSLTAARQAGGVVFDDRNANGLLDGSDRVVPGARVAVLNPLTGTSSDVAVSRTGSFVVDVGALQSVNVMVGFDLPAPAGGSRSVPVRVERRVEVGTVTEIALRPRPRSCSSVAVCDGLLLPDLISLAETPTFLPAETLAEYPGPDRWSIDRTTAPGRVLLRVATISANVGLGPLLVVGTDERDGTFRGTKQRLLDVYGSYLDVDSGVFEQSASHSHVHLQALEEIRLIGSASRVASARKISFCLTDVFPTAARPVTARPVSIELKLFECGEGQQGMNIGMADYYGPALADQFVDITGLVPGRYTLEIVSDPDAVLAELNESNNSVQLALELTAEQLR
jgi:Lysyl oxidase